MILLKQCEVFAPEPLGTKDVLVAGTRVVAVADSIAEPAGLGVVTIPGNLNADLALGTLRSILKATRLEP